MLTLNDIRLNKKLKSNPLERVNFFINWLKKQIISTHKLTPKVFPIDFNTAFKANKESLRWFT